MNAHRFKVESRYDNFRGFEQLVQGSMEIVDMLEEEFIETGGSKIESFVNTRKKVLHFQFDRESLYDLLELLTSRDKEVELMSLPYDLRITLQKALIEKVIRDYVPAEAVEDLSRSLVLLYNKLDQNALKTCVEVETYLKKGSSFASFYKKSQKFINEWSGIFDGRPNRKIVFDDII